MFTLELIELLNQYKKSQDKYDRQKILSSIQNLISQNLEQYQNFKSTQVFDEQTKQILLECENLSQTKDTKNLAQEEISEHHEPSDMDYIREQFREWLELFTKNNLATEQNIEIVKSLVNKYFYTKYEILEQLLRIENGQEYQLFKNMVLNEIRAKFAKQIQDYYTSDKFTNLGFFARRSTKKKISQILDEIGKYKFDRAKINNLTQT